MTQVFDENGNAVGVTVLSLVLLTVTQVKTEETDGYNAIQVGYNETTEKHLTKARLGNLSKNKLPLFRTFKEFRVPKEATALFSVGDVIDPSDLNSFLKDGAIVHVVGKSIGKGFQGTIKRWNQHRGPMSHGSKSHRLPGSIGSGTTPGNVRKGLRMARRMGNIQVTTTNLTVLRVYSDRQIALIRGSVPGVEGDFILVKPKREKWNKLQNDVKFTPANKKSENAAPAVAVATPEGEG